MLTITLKKRFIQEHDDGSFSIREDEFTARLPVRIASENVLQEVLNLETWLNKNTNVRAHLFLDK